MIRSLDATGFGDWQMIHHNWEAAYISLSRFAEWPLWDPFHCGGVPILGNPESQLYAPWFVLSFLFGTVVAVKIMLLGHIACAAAGMYWLARCRYELRPAASAVAAIAWSCSGCFVWDGAGGHATFLSFAFAPWLSFFVHCGRDVRRSSAAVAALLLLSLLEGGTYPLPFFAIWIGFELSVYALSRKAIKHSFYVAALSIGLLALCGAIRFLPIFLTLQAHPRQVPNHDALSLPDVWTMLTARTHEWRVTGHPFVWPEYGSYIGVAVLLTAAVGLALAMRGLQLHLLIGLALYLALMLGNVGSYAPYTLLHRLPVYDSLRVPSRFAVFVTFYLALLAGVGLEFVLHSVRHARWATALGIVCASGIAADLLSFSWPIAEMWNGQPLSNAAPADEFHLVKRYGGYASYPRLNIGTPACYVGGMNWPVSNALWLGREPQVRLPKGSGELHSWRRTPNTFHVSISLSSPTRIRFNQNFARGFVSSKGSIVEDDGLLALDLPSGTHDVTVRYQPRELMPSAAVSGIGLILLAWLLLRPRRGGLQTAQSAPASPSSATTPVRAGSVP